jgi:hypothetical protein
MSQTALNLVAISVDFEMSLGELYEGFEFKG